MIVGGEELCSGGIKSITWAGKEGNAVFQALLALRRDGTAGKSFDLIKSLSIRRPAPVFTSCPIFL
jgi:hypothetical protein